MVTQENLLGVSQHFFTPDIVAKISETVGQTKDKTMEGLKSIIPECVGGIVDKGSTPEGAATLVDMVNTHNFEKNTLPDAGQMNEGEEVVHSIFGSNLEPTLSRLSAQTNLDRNSLSKLLGIVAPICMGFIGAKIKREGLSMSGFLSFIKDQKKILSGYSRKSSEYYHLSGRHPETDYVKKHDKPIWKSWILAIVVGAVIMVWWNAVQYRSPATIRSPVSTVTSAPIATLDDFLASSNAANELPKSFYFDEIAFLGESTRLAGGFEEIRYVAGVLKVNPNVKVEIVGIAENVGTDKMTNEMANRRANLVRNELVAGGARPEQITTRGLAAGSPAGYTTTTPGNARFQRMELVVKSVK